MFTDHTVAITNHRAGTRYWAPLFLLLLLFLTECGTTVTRAYTESNHRFAFLNSDTVASVSSILKDKHATERESPT